MSDCVIKCNGFLAVKWDFIYFCKRKTSKTVFAPSGQTSDKLLKG